MRAIVVDQYGPPEQARVAEVPAPTPAPNEVLVRVVAAGVGMPDLLIMSGSYQLKEPLPFIPGSDFAGVVAATGSDVRGVKVGQRVCGSVHTGAFAEYVCVPEEAVHPISDELDTTHAAAFAVGYTTAWHALHSVGRLNGSERVAILGAAGGVGVAAVDLAVLAGAEVVAVVTGTAKAALCRARGADVVIDLEQTELRPALRDIGGIDLVVDMVGGPGTEQAFRGLRPRGRLVTIGYACGEIPRIPLNLVLLKAAEIRGFEMRNFAERFPDAHARGREQIRAILAEGRVVPYVARQYPFEKVADAMRDVVERRALGRVVLSIDADG